MPREHSTGRQMLLLSQSRGFPYQVHVVGIRFHGAVGDMSLEAGEVRSFLGSRYYIWFRLRSGASFGGCCKGLLHGVPELRLPGLRS